MIIKLDESKQALKKNIKTKTNDALIDDIIRKYKIRGGTREYLSDDEEEPIKQYNIYQTPEKYFDDKRKHNNYLADEHRKQIMMQLKQEKENKERENKYYIKGGAIPKDPAYKKYITERKQMKAEREKIRYDNLNIPLVCPICNISTNLNKINIHLKGKKCSNLYELLSDARQLHIKQKINRLTKTATDKNLNEREQNAEINKILEE
jgi:hypothetical protein